MASTISQGLLLTIPLAPLAGALIAGDLPRRRVIQIGAKSRHLDHFMFATAAVHHMHDAKAPSDDEGAPE